MRASKLQLPLQTLSLVVGFMVWVIISSLIPNIKDDIPLTDSQLSLVTAVPVILGSLMRIPLGFWTNQFGARYLFSISFVILFIPVFYISVADSFMDLLLGGLLLGLGGAVFSIGVTSLPKYYPKEKHGFVNGMYGAGNIGTAITSFAAPVLANQLGWTSTVRLFLILLGVFAVLNFVLGDRQEPKMKASFLKQWSGISRNTTMWFLCLFYFITFGSFVAFTIYLPNFLVSNFGLEPVDAGLRTAGFIALATLLRPIGGILGDKFNPFIILMIVFAGLTGSGAILSFSPGIKLYTFGCLMVAICAGIGNGTVFKLVPLYFSKQSGIVNGVVSAVGGLGGFFPPIVLTVVFNMTGHYAIGFMALSEFALASFVIVVWMYYQEKLGIEQRIMERTAQAMMVTDSQGIIRKINPAFTHITGYAPEEAIGQKANLLRSGKHDAQFYERMCKAIRTDGFWQGEIWNRRKDGHLYLEWLTISEVKDDGGEIKYYVGQFNDLTKSAPTV